MNNQLTKETRAIFTVVNWILFSAYLWYAHSVFYLLNDSKSLSFEIIGLFILAYGIMLILQFTVPFKLRFINNSYVISTSSIINGILFFLKGMKEYDNYIGIVYILVGLLFLFLYKKTRKYLFDEYEKVRLNSIFERYEYSYDIKKLILEDAYFALISLLIVLIVKYFSSMALTFIISSPTIITFIAIVIALASIGYSIYKVGIYLQFGIDMELRGPWIIFLISFVLLFNGMFSKSPLYSSEIHNTIKGGFISGGMFGMFYFFDKRMKWKEKQNGLQHNLQGEE